MTVATSPKMKASGVDWIGQIPAHWQVRSFRYCGVISNGQVDPRLPQFREQTLVAPNHIESGTGRLLGTETADEQGAESGKYVFEAGNVLYSKIRPELAKVCLIDFHGLCSADMYPIAPRSDVNAGFLAYQMICKGFTESVVLASARVAMPKVNRDELGGIPLVIPSLAEQRAIAAFLDRKTAQIDAVVAKKQRLIERLQEKRQALISHAVTKGLNPHAPMKDSGIEWLKEVPAHWMIRRFRHCGTIPNGQVDPRLPAYRDMVLIAPNHIESETGRLLLTETAFEQGAESGKYVAQEGDVIYSKIRPELQKACIAPERCLCSADMYPITPKPDMVAEYILYNLLCDWFTKYAVLWSDRVAMPKVNRETFGNCFMVVPPLDEQKRIVRYITTQTEHIDRMTDRIRTQIAKLQEYRQTLISAAVTGKIDVTKEASA